MSNPKQFKDPPIPKLKEALLKIKPSSYKGTCYRILSEQHNPLSTDGSLLCGGRYNIQNIFGALYMGESSDVCRAEILQKSIFPPRLDLKQVSLKVRLSKTLDLCEDKNLERLGIDKNDLLKKDRILPRTIAHAAYAEGYEALLAPSTTGKGNMLVIFPPNLMKNSFITLVESKKVHLD